MIRWARRTPTNDITRTSPPPWAHPLIDFVVDQVYYQWFKECDTDRMFLLVTVPLEEHWFEVWQDELQSAVHV